MSANNGMDDDDDGGLNEMSTEETTGTKGGSAAAVETGDDDDDDDLLDELNVPWLKPKDADVVDKKVGGVADENEDEHNRDEEDDDEVKEFVRATSLVDGRSVELRLRKAFKPEDASVVIQKATSDSKPGGRDRRLEWIRAELAKPLAVAKDDKDEDDMNDEDDESDDDEMAQRKKKRSIGQSFTTKYAPKGYGDLLTEERLNRELLRWLIEWKSGKVSEDNQCPVVVLAGPPGCGKTTLAHVLARHAGFEVVEINASDVRAGDAFEKAVIDAISFESVLGNQSGKPNLLLIDEIDGIASTTEGSGGGSGERGPAKVLANMIEATISSMKRRTARRSGRRTARRDEDANESDDDNASDNDDEFEESSGQQSAREGGRNRRRTRARGGGASSAKKPVIIRHPIICTCNDLFVPSLRPLRRSAMIVNVYKPSIQRLLQVLKRVSTEEHISITSSALTSLCELSNYDVRSSLNTLEFVSTALPAGTRNITPELVRSVAAGAKDMTESSRDVWQRLLLPSTDITNGARLISAVEGTGETERVLEGCWLNYPTLPSAQHDTQLLKYLECVESLSVTDTAAGQMQALPSNRPVLDTLWSLACLGYKIYGTDRNVATETLLMGGTTMNMQNLITFPSCHVTMWRHRQSLLNIAETLSDSLTSETRQSLFGMLPHNRRVVPPTSPLENELLPYLATILRPRLRNINKRFASPAELASLDETARIMEQFGITYRTSTEPPPAHLVLEPAIDNLLQYGGSTVDEALGHNDAFFLRQQQQHDNYGTPITHKRTPMFTVKRAEQSDAQRRLIMSEVESLKRRRSQEQFNAQAAAAPVIPQLEDLLQNATKNTPKVKSEDEKQDALQPPAKTRRDFFGRIIPVESPTKTATSTQKQTARTTTHVSLQNVRYKFQEGFTNAVKRKLTLSFFL